MIFDRSYIDVINARKVFANKVQNFLELAEPEQRIIDRAFFNLTALNRITAKINEIWELVVSLGGIKIESADVREWSSQEIFTIKNFASIHENIGKILSQINELDIVDLQPLQEAYETINDDYTYTNLNTLEKLLYDVYNELENANIAADSNYLTFSSPNGFTLSVVDNKKYWDGTLECSLDAINWGVWDGLSAVFAGGGRLYVRGTGNTYITGNGTSSTKGAWRLGGSNISISGNIETILDYATVANGEHPIMADQAFRVLFAYPFSEDTGTGGDENGTIIDASHLELPAMTLTYGCYWAMFQGCTGLNKAPSLPAQTLAYACYAHMFALCGLRSSPSLPATAIAEACYSRMFRWCKNLTTIPSLPATSLIRGCYYGMFEQCSKIHISTSKTEKYITAYRIPTSGNGTPAEEALYIMFAGTSGAFEGTDGTPSINTTYYTSNDVV